MCESDMNNQNLTIKKQQLVMNMHELILAYLKRSHSLASPPKFHLVKAAYKSTRQGELTSSLRTISSSRTVDQAAKVPGV